MELLEAVAENKHNKWGVREAAQCVLSLRPLILSCEVGPCEKYSRSFPTDWRSLGAPVQVGLETPPVLRLGPAEEAEVMLTRPPVSAFGAAFWRPSLEKRLSEQVSLRKREKKAREDEILASSISCKEHFQ